MISFALMGFLRRFLGSSASSGASSRSLIAKEKAVIKRLVRKRWVKVKGLMVSSIKVVIKLTVANDWAK